jgi:hypothetical protein
MPEAREGPRDPIHDEDEPDVVLLDPDEVEEAEEWDDFDRLHRHPVKRGRKHRVE